MRGLRAKRIQVSNSAPCIPFVEYGRQPGRLTSLAMLQTPSRLSLCGSRCISLRVININEKFLISSYSRQHSESVMISNSCKCLFSGQRAVRRPVINLRSRWMWSSNSRILEASCPDLLDYSRSSYFIPEITVLIEVPQPREARLFECRSSQCFYFISIQDSRIHQHA